MSVAAAGEILGKGAILLVAADVAQLVEHFTRNEGVRGSNPRVGLRPPKVVGFAGIATFGGEERR